MPAIFTIKTKMHELEYEVKSYSNNEFQNEVDETLSHKRIYLFLFEKNSSLSTLRKQSEIGNIKIIGLATSLSDIQLELRYNREITNVLIILNNPYIEKVGINEDLVAEFNPEQIIFHVLGKPLTYTLMK